MKLDKLRIERTPQLMIIPMIDIIFFLLVFFMMSTLYMVDQTTIPLSLPQAATGQSAQPSLVSITLTKQGQILVEQAVVPRELVALRIKTELSRNPEAAFVLRADRQVEYGQVVGIMDELKQLGVHRVAVATDQKR